MPIRIKTDLEFGQSFYLKNDPNQLEHSLVAVVVGPNNTVRFRLSFCGEECEVFDFEASTAIDETKVPAPEED